MTDHELEQLNPGQEQVQHAEVPLDQPLHQQGHHW